MPIMGKNALDDASLFTGDRNGVVIHAPLTVEGIITGSGSSGSFDDLTVTDDLTIGGTSSLADTLTFSALGKGVTLKTGTNGKAGTFTANGTTPVTVATTAFLAGSVVAISLKTVGGTVGAQPHLATATPATGFTVVATAADTSVYNWAIIDTAA